MFQDVEQIANHARICPPLAGVSVSDGGGADFVQTAIPFFNRDPFHPRLASRDTPASGGQIQLSRFFTVAIFILFPATTGARVVAADFFSNPDWFRFFFCHLLVRLWASSVLPIH